MKVDIIIFHYIRMLRKKIFLLSHLILLWVFFSIFGPDRTNNLYRSNRVLFFMRYLRIEIYISDNSPQTIDWFLTIVWVEIELIRLSLISIEKNNCFGCRIINSNNFCCLFILKFTYLIRSFSFNTKVKRWNFFCWVILLYLFKALYFFMKIYILWI